MTTNSAIHVRWMIRRDMDEVLAIEDASFPTAWTEAEFVRCLRQRNCIGMVVERDDRVVGYMIYDLGKSKIHVLNFAVDPSARLQGVGRKMVDKLVLKLSPQTHKRSRIVLEIRESNLDGQLFFKACGFRAVSVLKNFYDDTTEDAYVFQYRIKAEQECAGR